MSGGARDPELTRLLIEELGRHEEAIAIGLADEVAAKRSVHALKGSAGLAGERDLASALARIERRVREGDASAFDDAALLVRTARQRLSAGQRAMAAEWPEPPPDLEARPIDDRARVARDDSCDSAHGGFRSIVSCRSGRRARRRR